jgi:hypothetical protein
MSSHPSTLARRLRVAGTGVLVAGWLAAATVYFRAGPQEPGGVAAYTIVGGQVYPIERSESKRELQQLERVGGKATVWILGLNDWLVSLIRGPRLAYTLALVCAAVAGGCFYLAGLADEDDGS